METAAVFAIGLVVGLAVAGFPALYLARRSVREHVRLVIEYAELDESLNRACVLLAQRDRELAALRASA
jgi:hypothetical protein